MRIWTHLPIILVGLILGACAVAVDDVVESIPTRTYFQIKPESVGALTREIGYSKNSIEAALPGYTAETITAAVEARTVAAFGVFTDGIQVLQVHRGRGGRIGPVHGVTHHLAGPNGERIGSTFGDLRLNRSDCRVGRNIWRGMALCKARGTENITLVLAIPQYQGPFDRLAPPDELRNAVLQRIVWQP